ncbi:hypothetical protein ASG01_15450 [Chryseobacterium sp. Leaf180]|nr:hypothetical protein ASG01_15450 [Chryseobacterium sp. Leaf180]
MTAVDAALHVNPITTSVIVNNTTYYATQTVNGCESTASLAVLAFNVTLGTTDLSGVSAEMQVYPNPVREVLTISGTEKITGIAIYTAEGRKRNVSASGKNQ